VTLTDLRTPCVLVDQERLDRNIDRMQDVAERGGKRLRPHAKTHKSPDLAAVQVARGAVGICCAKLGEAEVFADRGIEDIRLPYPIHPVNADRVLALLDRTRLSFIVDDLGVAQGWSAALQAARRTADVLVKVDVGFHRCGIDPEPAAASAFVRRVADMPGLRFRGLLSHAGHAYAAASTEAACAIARDEAGLLTAIRQAAEADGLRVEEISVGATPTARFSAELPGITELRPGNYVYCDRMQVALGSASWDDCALTVLARVVSRPAPDRIILDSGSKTLTSDLVRGGGSAGYGTILTSLLSTEPEARLLIERLSEEHATVRVVSGQPAGFTPGDLVRIVPNHSCVVSNLVDRAWIVRGDAVVDSLQIAARGRIE
jgi:D-serine deaminase-like pyridoxal phosphate-dependent protein